MGRLSMASLASARHWPVASSTAPKLSSSPKRMLAGPAIPSPRTLPEPSHRRARHCVPPPSTPRKSNASSTCGPRRLRSFMNERDEIQMEVALLPLGPMETERPSPRYSGIDVWDPADVLDAMIEGQFSAVAAVRAARPALERAALAMEARLRHCGRLIYAGAGTSGRLAVQDGAELMPTFSWPPERLLLLIAGGDKAMVRAVEGAEDEVGQATELVKRHGVGADDVLIAVAASGTTPFTLACLREARRQRRLDHRHCQQSAERRSSRRPSTRSFSTPGRSRSPARRA